MLSLKENLMSLSEEEYRIFASKLLPNVDNIIGVRVPLLRKTAKLITKGEWRKVIENMDNDYFEEKMVEGLIIAYAKMDILERFEYIRDFITKIDNWSVCDTFCNTLKFTNMNKEEVLNFLKSYIDSDDEYTVRFVAVMLLNYYVEEEYLDDFFDIINVLCTEKYYAQMAVAWAVSIAYIKFPESTDVFLKDNDLDNITFNKSLQKIRESNRISKDVKEYIKEMKRG